MFSSDSFQKRSKINSDNRGKLEVNHVAGSKSFVRLRYDMRDSITGQEPKPVDFYKGTHCRQATGSWIHPRASEIWEEMNTLRSQPTPDGTQRSEPEILSQVLGTRSGYVRGFGHGAKLMAPARAASSRSIVVGDNAVCRADTAERKVQQLRVVVDDIKDQLDRQRDEQHCSHSFSFQKASFNSFPFGKRVRIVCFEGTGNFSSCFSPLPMTPTD
ncbi:uncharacterized protein LOC131254161 [Magnolia sinica]|uniref:uncharacterized protein LOC131254161 n=1 Tax=Magnolia sinica TaxID=86752 RepID=UPI002657B0A8|nr:uncharacterized protein LOC131254161 [Magnolia sinica]